MSTLARLIICSTWKWSVLAILPDIYRYLIFLVLYWSPNQASHRQSDTPPRSCCCYGVRFLRMNLLQFFSRINYNFISFGFRIKFVGASCVILCVWVVTPLCSVFWFDELCCSYLKSLLRIFGKLFMEESYFSLTYFWSFKPKFI